MLFHLILSIFSDTGNSVSLKESDEFIQTSKIPHVSSSSTLVTIPEENHHNCAKVIPENNSKPDVTYHNDSVSSSRRGSHLLPSMQKIFTFNKTSDTSHRTSDASVYFCDDRKNSEPAAIEAKRKNRRNGNDALSTALSALYAKFIVILGIALPLTEILSHRLSSEFYQLFYLYLYAGSCVFVSFVYFSRIRMKSRIQMVSGGAQKNTEGFGSFYLRVGAIAFGIGAMVYSGLEFGQYFESRCK